MAARETGQEEEGEGYDSLVEKQRLKAALHHAVGRVCEEVEEAEFSREVVAAMTEAAFNQSQLLAQDLEAFAKHAKRTVVSCDDVKLCCRRSNDLLDYMTNQIDRMKAKRMEKRGEGRGGGGGEEGEEGGGEEVKVKQGRKKRKTQTKENDVLEID